MGSLLGTVSALASLLVAATATGTANFVLAGGAIIAIAGGVASAIYGARTKTSLRATQDAGRAWKDERDAEKAKAERLENVLRDTTAALEAEKARTDLSALERLVVRQHEDVLQILTAVKDSVRAATTAIEFMSKHTFPTSLEGDL